MKAPNPIAPEPSAAPSTDLRAGPRRVLDGYGRAVTSSSLYAEPDSVEALAAIMARAQDEGLPVALRGAGRSYGDAALGEGGLVIGTEKLNRILSWDPASGVLEAEPGVTIEDLWRATLESGHWPHVVPGTMFPTLGGCVAANIHGKNHFAVGAFGDHLEELDVLTATGETLRCSADHEADLMRAVVGSFGALGVATRIKLRLKPIETGKVRVEAWNTPNLEALFDDFEKRLASSDYLVGWVDAFATGKGLGRAVIHQANYLGASEVPDAAATLALANQDLPDRFFGVIPRGAMWRLLSPFTNSPGMRLVNLGKFAASKLLDRKGKTYEQSLVAFQFLLDYVPRWREAYGPGGFIQVQPFIPVDSAREALARVLQLCHDHDLPPYLAVFKRHRPDHFLLSHALDGYSMALDFPVTRANRDRVWALGQAIGDVVVDAGGRFYFAKDAVARADQVEASFGRERLDAFAALKQRVDPQGLLSTELTRRLLPELPVIGRA